MVHEGDLIAWQALLPSGRTALAIFNLGDAPMTLDRDLGSFSASLAGRRWQVRDAWADKDLGEQSRISMQLRPHACVMLMLR